MIDYLLTVPAIVLGTIAVWELFRIATTERNIPVKPKWRVTPNADGTWMLEQYHADIDLYLPVVASLESGAAIREAIEKMERAETPL